ncbi:alpha-beta hydrolase superfamily lysophospholipase [Streptomyces pseudovenezuelae]|uniref:Alpha-beta hydrolase superfamily lysophospholipase n=1 Tax=Streptomyces pseudovenezuelae TaxID=67350 RepID=A0ABT6LVH2_9ACTN|nr:alpha-beta hydrolase superfamily lysophospholipase [Streptomyces pseudovenezuelae]
MRRGSLDDVVPEAVLNAAYDSDAAVPALLLVGDADPLADHEALAQTAKSLSRARLSVVHGAHHDVLNDLQHRSVAAEVVTFLETLRNELRPLITVRSSAW